MKRLLLIPLIAILLFTSCEENRGTHSDLVVRFACEKFAMQERSLLPKEAAMTIAKYRITGTGPNNQSVDVTGTTSEVTLGQLLMGKWVLTAQALNNEDAILAQGTLTTMLSSVTSSAEITLTELVGDGSLSVFYTWALDQVADDVTLDLSLLNQDGTAVSITAPTVNKATGAATFAATLPSGSYTLISKLSSQGVVVSGSAEAVRIVAGTPTTGALEMKMGDRSTVFSMTVINNTMMPIRGTVTCNPELPTAGSDVTLTFAPTNLQGVAANDLIISWYCEGIGVGTNNLSYTSKPKAGSHRYDVIVSHAKLGSLGSTTILVDMPIK
ncbi:MAG: hypothetical protein RBR15_04960 [Sphaerochaeta sp.]|nr:hypothetical protein [Sphaerochaeta sp.]